MVSHRNLARALWNSHRSTKLVLSSFSLSVAESTPFTVQPSNDRSCYNSAFTGDATWAAGNTGLGITSEFPCLVSPASRVSSRSRADDRMLRFLFFSYLRSLSIYRSICIHHRHFYSHCPATRRAKRLSTLRPQRRYFLPCSLASSNGRIQHLFQDQLVPSCTYSCICRWISRSRWSRCLPRLLDEAKEEKRSKRSRSRWRRGAVRRRSHGRRWARVRNGRE